MRAVLCAAAMLVLLASGGRAETFSYVDLVSRLTDLDALAVLPVTGETCAQASSYDRASRYDAASGTYVNWDANGDGHGIIRVENDLHVFAEIEGPGCIWRIWSAAPKEGRVMIYLDGNAEPAVDLPFSAYFDLKHEPFVYPSLVHYTAQGANCYVPIPFQKSCRIVAEPNWGAYYHFVYSTFPKDTKLPTFTRSLSDAEKAALKAADDYLTNRLGTPPPERKTDETVVRQSVALEAGKTAALARLDGPRAITSIRVRPRSPTRAVLRNVALRIFWDGEQKPAVWVPIGDFFGTAPGVNTYRSLPLGMTDTEFYSLWYMPFASSAVVELVNEGEERFDAEFAIGHSELDRDIGDLGRFHAKWHRDAFLPTEPERWIDWTMLVTQGRGRYCGVMLEVWNPRGGWWGEGDEKFFVDGEKFPSTFGTGSEDYFGYAWCDPTLFENAYHSQTISQGNKGHISVNRWHIADNVPFQKSFEGFIEKYFSNDRPTLYACTAYWYLAPGGTDPYGAVPVEERTFYVQPEAYGVKGAIEGERLKVLSITGGSTSAQELPAHGGNSWSEDAHLWWTGASPGDRLTLALPVEKSGKFDIRAQFTKAADYGIVRLSLNGSPLGDSIDLYNDGVVPTGEMSLGVKELTAGEHRLTIEIAGANEAAVKAYMFGLDYVRLAPAD